MSLAYTPDRLRLPDSLQAQLHEFRRRVWTIKMVEAVAAAAFGVLVAYLLLFCLDRVWDTPGWLRVGLFVAAAVACAKIPWALHRWVWRHRRLEQLARLLARKHPRVGDQLLGIIELVRNDFEQARSPDAVRGRDPRGCPRRAAARFSRCGSQPAPPALDLAGGRPDW